MHFLILGTDNIEGGGGPGLFVGHSGRLLCYLMVSNCPSFLFFSMFMSKVEIQE